MRTPSPNRASAWVYALVIFIAASQCLSLESYAQRKQDSSARIIDERVIYELPIAYELMHIGMALADSSIVSSGYKLYYEVVDTSTAYYKEVMAYFSPYRDHKLIAALNASLREKASHYASNLQVAYNTIFIDGDLKKQSIMPWVRRAAANPGECKPETGGRFCQSYEV